MSSSFDLIILTLKVDQSAHGNWNDWRDGGERGQDHLEISGLAIGQVGSHLLKEIGSRGGVGWRQ